MRKRLATIATTAGLIFLAGCGGSEPQDEATTAEGSIPEPPTHTIIVEIIDTVPLSLYFNQDDVVCTAVSAFDPEEARPPEITIEDGEGTILAAQDGPSLGGTSTETGCTVRVTFPDIPEATVYKVVVTGWDGTTVERTVEGESTEQIITVDA